MKGCKLPGQKCNNGKQDCCAKKCKKGAGRCGCINNGKEPLVKTVFGTGVAIGPGGQDIVLDNDGATWLLYHSWDPTITYRPINLDELVWEDGKPVLRGPNGAPQAKP